MIRKKMSGSTLEPDILLCRLLGISLPGSQDATYVQSRLRATSPDYA